MTIRITIRRITQTGAALALLAITAAAGSVPSIDLRDPSGTRVMKGELKESKEQTLLAIRDAKLAPGVYRAELSRGRKCFEANGVSGQVAATGPFEIRDDTDMTSGIPFPAGVAEAGGLRTLVDEGGLLLNVVPAAGGVAACGRVEPWFTPGRDIRRGTDR